jgi:tyrosinase
VKQCTLGATLARREWGSLSKSDRKEYIDAVPLHVVTSTSLSPEVVPSAKSRFDDLVAAQINQTLSIHLGIFLSWHRNLVWLWETALGEECGYPGYLPYWNWPLCAGNLSENPLFDGSETSLSGDGLYEPEQDPYIVGGGATLPHGTGGGCVTNGPFVNMTSSFGPFQFGLVFTWLPANWTAYSPSCLQRDINDYVATRYTN